MSKATKGSLTIYVDCVSPYSWFGFTSALKYRTGLQSHGVSIDIVPFFLGGAREIAGSPFQPTHKAKEGFANQDTETVGALLGLKVVRPKVFPINSLYPLRISTWVKDHRPEKFDETYGAFSEAYWSKGINISTPDGIVKALEGVFPREEIESIMKESLSPENKKKVVDATKESGAFGAPWIVAVNNNGEKRSFFGNDRWDQVFHFMGVPYQPVTIIPNRERARL